MVFAVAASAAMNGYHPRGGVAATAPAAAGGGGARTFAVIAVLLLSAVAFFYASSPSMKLRTNDNYESRLYTAGVFRALSDQRTSAEAVVRQIVLAASGADEPTLSNVIFYVDITSMETEAEKLAASALMGLLNRRAAMSAGGGGPAVIAR